MVTWNPGADPFPGRLIRKITDFQYVDELKFVRHASVHVNKKPSSLWQLSANFRANMKVHPLRGKAYSLTIKAPRGLVTDLASVPKPLWNIVGPIGPHLEASIIHDYLYMGWTDFRTDARLIDWNFADEVFRIGLFASRAKDRKLIHAAVRALGWPVFKNRTETLKKRMDAWLPMLAQNHGRGG